jgi:hypothetical protein
VFERAFTTPHAVWFTTDASGDAHLTVAVRLDHAPRTFETMLDARTAARLKVLCHAFLSAKAPACERLVPDGPRYYVAEYEDGGYLMRSFASPRWGTRDDKFVRVAEALRDYAVAPDSLKSVYSRSIQRAADELECELDSNAVPGCSHQ